MPPQKLILTNQFGEESINYVTAAAWFPLAGTDLVIGSGASAPTSGASGTGDDIAGTGSLYVARDTGLLYQQVGLITAPSWVALESGSSELGQVLTGLVAAAGDVTAADTILTAFNKLAGNFAVSAPSLTFDHSVGALVCSTRLAGHLIADGAGTVCASTALAAGLRPPAAVTFPVVVIDAGATRTIGQVVIGADGIVTFSVLGAGFTNALAAGWDACSVTYALA